MWGRFLRNFDEDVSDKLSRWSSKLTALAHELSGRYSRGTGLAFELLQLNPVLLRSRGRRNFGGVMDAFFKVELGTEGSARNVQPGIPT